MYGLKKRSKQDENGLIQGAGTGTSDDIKKNVPAGSYIMPADSTKQIGTNNLKNMGSPTPVNLSNGEFQLSPDQVHSVGVQTLDAMKNQTHVPVDQPQLGFKPGQNKPELFFANGGLVPSAYPSADDIRRAQQNRIGGPQMRDVTPINRQLPATSTAPSTTSSPSASPSNPAPTQGGGFGARMLGKAGNIAKGLGKAHVGLSIAGGLYQGKDTTTDEYRERFGFDEPKYDGSFTEGAKEAGTAILGKLTDIGNAASFGIFGRNFADKQRINAENDLAAQQKRYAEWNARKQQQGNTESIDNPVINSSATKTTTQNQQQNSVQNDPYAIQQKGNSFSYANPSAAAQARADGIREGEGLGFKVRPVNDPRGVANLFANTQEMGPTEQQIQNAIAQREMNIGMQGRAGIPREIERPTLSDEEKGKRDALARQINSAINPKYGPTAKQADMLLQLSSDNPNALDVYKTDANNAAALQREAMGQAGQNYRTELSEQGTNNRFNANLGFDAQKFQATNDLANREFNLNATEKGFGIRNSARLEKLYEQYDSAKSDEDRKSIQEKINRYAGRKESESSNPYITVKRGEILDEKGNTIQPAGEVLFNRITGQTIDPLAQMPQSTNIPNGMTRQVGTSNGKPVYEDAQGNRFIGN